METYQYIIAIFGGLLAGIINTLAGNGSAITLTILMEVIGLPPNVANGTNRIGVLSQGVFSVSAFYKNGKLHLKRDAPIIISVFLGAILGLWAALTVGNDDFKFIFSILMVLMLFVILVKPKRWIKEVAIEKRPNIYYLLPVFFILGFYGGFIQMGMGIFFLAASVLLARYPIVESNGLKIVCIALYSIVVLSMFAYHGLIAWQAGLALAIGQSAGGWIAANFATQHPKANIVTYWLLVIIVIGAIIKLFFF